MYWIAQHQHKSDLYTALADRLNNIVYFHEYLDQPESIARYKIMSVRGSLGIVASSNAEAGHANNEHAVPIQLIGILAIDKQILRLLTWRLLDTMWHNRTTTAWTSLPGQSARNRCWFKWMEGIPQVNLLFIWNHPKELERIALLYEVTCSQWRQFWGQQHLL